MECWSPKHVLDSDVHFCHVYEVNYSYNFGEQFKTGQSG